MQFLKKKFETSSSSQFLVNDIQKYNGKNVAIDNFWNIFISSDLFFLCVYIPPQGSADLCQLKNFLKTQQVYFVKNKKKNFLVGLDKSKVSLFFNFHSLQEFRLLMNISGLFLIFTGYEHFLHFYNKLNQFLFQKKLVILFFKTNTQLIIPSLFFSKIQSLLFMFSGNLVSVNSFFVFCFRFVIFYFLFISILQIQNKLFPLFLKVI
jgi:hypothetical protein